MSHRGGRFARGVSRALNCPPGPADTPHTMSAQNDPSERPEGLETRPESTSLPGETERPDWLVGSEDVLQGERDPAEPARPTIAEASARRSLRVIPGGNPTPSKGWSGAASSVPKLSVVPTPTPPDPSLDLDDATDVPGLAADLPASAEDRAEVPTKAAPAFRPLQEPWYLVWAEALATQGRVQVVVLVAAVGLATFFFWPRGGASGASLGSILRHPETYQGRSVVVRGEVLEIFEVGTGRAFQLRQGRDVLVVYSTMREPRLHDRVEVRGIVSTGYLDGAPRVAIFEGGVP